MSMRILDHVVARSVRYEKADPVSEPIEDGQPSRRRREPSRRRSASHAWRPPSTHSYGRRRRVARGFGGRHFLHAWAQPRRPKMTSAPRTGAPRAAAPCSSSCRIARAPAPRHVAMSGAPPLGADVRTHAETRAAARRSRRRGRLRARRRGGSHRSPRARRAPRRARELARVRRRAARARRAAPASTSVTPPRVAPRAARRARSRGGTHVVVAAAAADAQRARDERARVARGAAGLRAAVEQL